jgi:hypothetical protein
MDAESHITHFFPPPYGISYTPINKKGVKYVLSIKESLFEYLVKKLLVIIFGIWAFVNMSNLINYLIFLKQKYLIMCYSF